MVPIPDQIHRARPRSTSMVPIPDQIHRATRRLLDLVRASPARYKVQFTTTFENICLRRRSHNGLEAEERFSSNGSFMAQKRLFA